MKELLKPLNASLYSSNTSTTVLIYNSIQSLSYTVLQLYSIYPSCTQLLFYTDVQHILHLLIIQCICILNSYQWNIVFHLPKLYTAFIQHSRTAYNTTTYYTMYMYSYQWNIDIDLWLYFIYPSCTQFLFNTVVQYIYIASTYYTMYMNSYEWNIAIALWLSSSDSTISQRQQSQHRPIIQLILMITYYATVL